MNEDIVTEGALTDEERESLHETASWICAVMLARHLGGKPLTHYNRYCKGKVPGEIWFYAAKMLVEFHKAAHAAAAHAAMQDES